LYHYRNTIDSDFSLSGQGVYRPRIIVKRGFLEKIRLDNYQQNNKLFQGNISLFKSFNAPWTNLISRGSNVSEIDDETVHTQMVTVLADYPIPKINKVFKKKVVAKPFIKIQVKRVPRVSIIHLVPELREYVDWIRSRIKYLNSDLKCLKWIQKHSHLSSDTGALDWTQGYQNRLLQQYDFIQRLREDINLGRKQIKLVLKLSNLQHRKRLKNTFGAWRTKFRMSNKVARLSISQYKQFLQFIYFKSKDFKVKLESKRLIKVGLDKEIKLKALRKISTTEPLHRVNSNIYYLRSVEGVYFSYWVGRLATMFMREGKKKRTMWSIYKALLLLKFQYNKSPLLILYEILESVKPIFLLRKYKRGRRSKVLNLYPYVASNTKRYLKALQWLHDDLEVRKKKRKTINNMKKKMGDKALILRQKGSVDVALHYRLFFKINEIIAWPDRPVHSKRNQRKHLLYRLRDEQNNLAVKNQYNTRFNWRKKKLKRW
jgi:ribosomal protein S7